MHARADFLTSICHTAPPPSARVLLFVADLSPTGVVRNSIAIANRLAHSGFAVDLVACRAEGELAGELDPGVAVTSLLQGPPAPRPLELARSLSSYRRHVRRTAPDVLLSAGNHGHMLSRVAWGAAGQGARVYRISNDLDHAMAGKPESRIGRFARRLQFRLFASAADRLVLVSQHLARDPLVANAPFELIPNGVDAAAVRERAQEPCSHPWLADGRTQTIVMVGRLARQKNIPTLLRALALARRTKPLRLVIVGSGSDAARTALEEEARRLGVEEAVSFAGATANPFPYMARASAVVLPSWWEGASNVLLEAMACGTPVVASRTAGNAQHVLGNGRYGLLVDPADDEGMADAILTQTGTDPCLPGKRGEAFSREAALTAYVALISRLAAGKVSRTSNPEASAAKPSTASWARATAATRLRPRPVPETASLPGAR